MEEKVKDYFKRYPTSGECYVNGGLLFHTRGAADSYGKGETKKYTRNELQNNASQVEDALRTVAVKQLKETEDLSTLAYQTQLNLVKALGLETEDKKGEIILKALSDYKETLKDE